MNEALAQLYGYLYGMWRYRWSALFITWIVAIIGWFVVLTLPDQYSVRSVVYIDTTSVMTPLLKGLAPEADSRDELAVMTRVLLSRENLLKLIADTDMDLDVKTAAEREELVLKLSRDITIKGSGSSGKKSGKDGNANNIYELSYQNTSAERAYLVVSSLLNTMIENALNSTRTDTVTAQKFLDAQIKEYEERLAVSEQLLAEFKKANIGYMPDEKGSYYARLQRAQDAVESTRSKLKLATQRSLELNKQLNGENPTLNGEVVQSASAEKIRQLEEQLKTLLISYTDKHPDVLALKASIENAKKAGLTEAESTDGGTASVEFNPVYQEMKVEANKAGVEVGILKIQLEDQLQYVEKLRSFIDVIPEVEAKLTRLNRDYEVTRTRYLDLVERRESARLAESASKSSSDITFRVIEQPVAPVAPSGPPRMLYLVAALVVAMGAGLAWSFLRFMLSPTFFDSRQLGEKTGLPILGTISLYLSPQHRNRRRVQLISFLSATCLLIVVFTGTMIFHEKSSRLISSAVSSLSES